MLKSHKINFKFFIYIIIFLILAITILLVVIFSRQSTKPDTYDIPVVEEQFMRFYSDINITKKTVSEVMEQLAIAVSDQNDVLYLSNFVPNDFKSELPEEPILILLFTKLNQEQQHDIYETLKILAESNSQLSQDDTADLGYSIPEHLQALFKNTIIEKSGDYVYFILHDDAKMVELELKSLNPAKSPLSWREF